MDESSPFHFGEKAVQARLGVQDKVHKIAPRLIRNHLTEQHREFYPQLSTLLVGSRDSSGAMWASILSGQPGFVQAPDFGCLRIQTLPINGDPLAENLQMGSFLGVLGLEFETRRRNRAAGHVISADSQGFSIHIKQSFGNCPKYIQTRSPQVVAKCPTHVSTYQHLTQADRSLISKADTFFIASGIEGDLNDSRTGNDVSHRGGRPGFVKVDGNALTWPDFVGNFLFNTLGNLAIDPRAGILFIDFDRGDTLQLSGRAKVLWDDPRLTRFSGAERFVRFQLDKVIRIDGGLPLRWAYGEQSPFNKPTGVW